MAQDKNLVIEAEELISNLEKTKGEGTAFLILIAALILMATKNQTGSLVQAEMFLKGVLSHAKKRKVKNL